MTLNRSLILAASVLAFGAGAAHADDSQNNARIQRSIYDTVRGDVAQPSGSVVLEGRAASAAPLPADSRAQLHRDQFAGEPDYFSQARRTD